MPPEVIVLSDGESDDDDVAFVGSRCAPNSPVFVGHVVSTVIEVLDVSDDESDGPGTYNHARLGLDAGPSIVVNNPSSDPPQDYGTNLFLPDFDHHSLDIGFDGPDGFDNSSLAETYTESFNDTETYTDTLTFDPSPSLSRIPDEHPVLDDDPDITAVSATAAPVLSRCRTASPEELVPVAGPSRLRPTVLDPAPLRPRSASTDTSASRATSRVADVTRPRRSLQDMINELTRSSPEPVASPSPEPESAPKSKKRKSTSGDPNEDSEDDLSSEQLAKKREAAKRKADREAEKEVAKEARKLARDNAKAEKEAEKSYQRKLAEVNRLRTTKIDALRDLEIHMAHNLSLPSSPIASALPELRTRVSESQSSIHFFTADDTVVDGAIQFRRHVRAEWNMVIKRYVPLEAPRMEWETTTVLVASAEDIVDRVALGDDALIEWLSDVRLTLRISPAEQLLLLVRGISKYHAKTKSIVDRTFRETARAGLAGEASAVITTPAVTGRVDKAKVETELLRAQVVQRVFVVHVDKTEDIEDWLFNLAGDVAIRPYKLLSKSHLPFSAPEGGRKAGEPREALELMLQEVQGLTASAAAGITEEHRTFRALMEAYASAETKDGLEAEEMVAECRVRSLRNGVAANRNVGKALSRKVFNLMRGDDALALA